MPPDGKSSQGSETPRTGGEVVDEPRQVRQYRPEHAHLPAPIARVFRARPAYRTGSGYRAAS
jgi:hypothetical protein